MLQSVLNGQFWKQELGLVPLRSNMPVMRLKGPSKSAEGPTQVPQCIRVPECIAAQTALPLYFGDFRTDSGFFSGSLPLVHLNLHRRRYCKVTNNCNHQLLPSMMETRLRRCLLEQISNHYVGYLLL